MVPLRVLGVHSAPGSQLPIANAHHIVAQQRFLLLAYGQQLAKCVSRVDDTYWRTRRVDDRNMHGASL